MTTQPATLPLSVVPGAGISNEIEITFKAPEMLKAAIEEFKKQRTDARAELANSLAKDLATAPPNLDTVIAKQQASKAKDEALAAKIKACEELLTIIQKRLEELKRFRRDAVKAFLQGKLDKLEAEMASEEGKEALLKHEIAATKKLLHELQKPPYAEAAKSKKE